jgi:predicted metal-dependent hydrolase
MEDYDPRFLAGVMLFNAGDFFEAHEIWEDLWAENFGDARRFYQGLIQAAVGLCHFGNGNLGGALKLYRSSLGYLEGLGDRFSGVDLARFRTDLEGCYRPLLGSTPPDRSLRPEPESLPRLSLDPTPAIWPDPEAYLPDEH